MPTRLGRPRNKAVKTATFRLKESEWEDLKKCAIHADLTMADWLRGQVKKYKRLCQNRGDWPEVADRGGDDGEIQP